MIPIAHPIASHEVSQLILDQTIAEHDKKTLISGKKACQKTITQAPKDKIMVFSATTSPMDLITHMPIICEDNGIPYIFVEDNKWIKGFTCVCLTIEEGSANIPRILKETLRK